MDVETREMLQAIQTQISGLAGEMRAGHEALRAEMRAGDEALRAEMRESNEALRAEMRAEMREGHDALRADMRAEMRESNEALRAEMRAEMREGHDALRADMRAGDETTRRHFDVVAERLYSLIRTVAEGVAANTEAIERLGHDLRGEMDARFKSFEMILRATFAGLRRDIDDLRTQS